jgi:hypothetical protein
MCSMTTRKAGSGGPARDAEPADAEAMPVERETPPSRPGGFAGRVADILEDAVDAARAVVRRWEERPGPRARRLRWSARRPLADLYADHPEARSATPREAGVQTIDVDRIAGTAAGTAARRGADFLPIRQLRTRNWTGRWQRIRQASDRLTVLPPIDVLKYDDRYWVVDGHNRVAAALYGGQIQIDANVTELVPPGEVASEQATRLAPVLTGSQAVRTAGRGRRVGNLSHEDLVDEAPESS